MADDSIPSILLVFLVIAVGVWVVCTIQFGFKEGYRIAGMVDSVLGIPFMIWYWTSDAHGGPEQGGDLQRGEGSQ